MSKHLENINFVETYKRTTHRWLSPDDLESEYGFKKSTQAKMRMAKSNSEIPFCKVGKQVRYDRVAIDKWLEYHQVQGEKYVC